MSGLLDSISRDFTHRLEVRRRMMAHLGLHLSDPQAVAHRDDLRKSLISCAKCPNPDVCEGWVAQNRPGTPMFCHARESFLRLEHALDAEIRLRA